MKTLAAKMRHSQPAVIHFQWLPAPLLDGLLVRRLARIAPLVLTLHNTNGLFHGSIPRLQSLTLRSMFNSFRAIIVHTQHSRKRVLEQGWATQDRVHVIPHGALDYYRALESEKGTEDNERERTILFFGAIESYKGLDVLIEAFARIPTRIRHETRLIVAGRPGINMTPLLDRAQALGIGDRITWDLRFFRQTEIPALFRRATVVALPYTDIDQSGVLMTALAFDRPVVASRVGGISETIQDPIHGRLVPPNDPSELAAALTAVLANPEGRAFMEHAIRQLRCRDLSWNSIARQTLDLYEQLVGTHIPINAVQVRQATVSTNVEPSALAGKSRSMLTSSRPAVFQDTKQRLRVGVLVPAGKLQRWLIQLLAEIKEVPGTELLLIRTTNVPSAKLSITRDYSLYGWWKSLDAIFSNRNDACLLSEIPEDMRQGYAVEITLAGQQSLSVEDAEKIRAAQLDLILNPDLHEKYPQLLGAAAHGLWSFSENTQAASWEGAFWDIYKKRHTITENVVCHQSGGDRIICSSTAAADPWSVARHRNRVYWRRSGTFKKALQSALCAQPVEATGQSTMTFAEESVALQAPGNLEMLCFVGRQLVDGVRRIVRRFFFTGQWFVGVRRKQSGADIFHLNNFKLLTAPRDRFFADPFVFEKEGHNYLFFEEFRSATRKGVILCVEFNDSGFLDRPKVVLKTDCHLSYPFMFEWRGQTYMMPEMSASGRVCLFRATDFPFRWQFEQVLLEGVTAVDPTLVEHADRFWLFVGGADPKRAIDTELFLYFSDSPFGPWTPHPRNPIVSDVTRARPAGQIFRHQGRLIRPGQDCSQLYGRAVVLNHIEELSVSDYRETPILTLEPHWQPGNVGTHTFNQSENYQVVDGRFSRYRPFGDIGLVARWGRYSSLFSMRRSVETRDRDDCSRQACGD